MDSAGPIEQRTAGQPTVFTGSFTFAPTGTFEKAENGFVFDRPGRASPRPHRDPHHPSATGDRPPA